MATPTRQYIVQRRDAPGKDREKEFTEHAHNVRLDIESAYTVLEDAHARGLRNANFWAGAQWTEDEINTHTRQRRKAFVLNEIKPKVDHLLGTQRQTRLDIQLAPREESDTAAADKLTKLVKWAEQMNDIKILESDIFQDVIIKGIGFAKMYWSLRDIVDGFPALDKLPFDGVVWDMNSMRKDWSDCDWVADVRVMSRSSAKAALPDYTEAIDNAQSATYISRQYNAFATRRELRIEASGYANRSRDKDLIHVVEHYERSSDWEYVVYGIMGEKEKFDTKQQAEDYAAGLEAAYLEQGKLTIDVEDGSDLVQICMVEVSRITQSILVGDTCILREKTCLPDFPIIPCWAYFDDGDFHAFVDLLIDPQIFANRMLSTWDHMLGSAMKNMTTVVKSMLDKRFGGLERVRQEISSVSPVIDVLDHKAIQVHQRPPISPELFQGLGMVQQRMQEYAGGANALGLQENAAESGRAVRARQAAAGVARLPLFDNLQDWRKRVTEQFVWNIKKFMVNRQSVQITGTDGAIEYVKLDDGVMDTLREIEVNVIVDEAPSTEDLRERTFEQIVRLSEVAQIPPGVKTDLLIANMPGLPAAEKKKLMERIDLHAQLQQAQAELEKMKKEQEQVESTVRKSQMREKMLNGQTGEDAVQNDKFATDLLKKMSEAEQVKRQRLQAQLQEFDPITRSKVLNALGMDEPTNGTYA